MLSFLANYIKLALYGERASMKYMTRRGFIGVVTAGSAVSSAQERETAVPSRIIDTHTHFYDPFRPQGVPWPPKSDTVLYRRALPPDLQKAAHGLPLAGTVVIEASALFEDNQWLLDLAKNDPLIVGVVGHLEPGKPAFKGHLERFAKNSLFRGIRLEEKGVASGLPEKAFIADLERLADADLELDVIGENAMLAYLVKLSDRIAHLRMVINHLPFDRGVDEASAQNAKNALRELGQRPQIFAKVSGVLRRINGRVPAASNAYQQSLDALWNIFGIDRLVYGSNWPVSDLLAPYPTVVSVVREYFRTKGVEATEKYFWRNSLAAYKWADRRR
jgi:L-fuconolactonase